VGGARVNIRRCRRVWTGRGLNKMVSMLRVGSSSMRSTKIEDGLSSGDILDIPEL